MRERISKILCEWNIESTDIEQVQDTTWDIGNKYILKVYDDKNTLERNIKIISVLTNMNIPVGRFVTNKHGVAFSNDNQYYYILCDKLNGKPITSLRSIDGIPFEMGKIIAKLHNAFKKCEQQDEFWSSSLLGEMKGWIKDNFNNNEWKLMDKGLFEDTIQHLEAVYENLPIQLIHRDVHFGNFLFDEERFSGYIDFDLSQRNIRIFDLCYFVIGLLSEREKLGINEDDWFLVLRDVFRGYHQIIRLSSKEIEAVPYVMMSIELLFAAWFLGENSLPFAESAISLFHFVNDNSKRIISEVQAE